MKKLDDLLRKAKQLEKPTNVPLLELLTPTFVQACSCFQDCQTLFDASGFEINSVEDFEAIGSEWDAFISQNTSYPNWTELLEVAGAQWMKRKLGL